MARWLLFKLKQNGVECSLYNWIKNYLSSRQQRVFVGSAFSENKLINAGVPQGSVLGPMLFLIYVNDITDRLISTARLFADDSSIAISSPNINIIEKNINNDLMCLTEWSKQWLVNFNASKTDAMLFSLRICNQPSLTFNNAQLQFVDTINIWG